MKSRKFPHIHSAATADSAAQGFLLANSSAPQDDVAAATVRRFELQYNKSPRFARRRKERRQGQALLLAVLIMLLAALLGAGFLAVVSGNLNQSARVADKTRAIEASRAGIAYANAQLSGSSQGDLWRPVDVSPAPQPNDAAYNFYYSQLDKVQGWSAKRRPVLGENFPNADYPAPISNYDQALAYYRSVTYGKFPDPNQVAGDAPKFLVKVREVPSNINDPEYEADHVGEIKITSIGLSEDNPNVFNRAVAYKAGRKKSPWASALRSISNWKFGDTDNDTGVPFGDVTAIATANPSGPVPVTINNTDKPQFSEKEVPFNIVIVKKDSVAPANSTVRGAVVTGVATTGTTTTLTLAKLDSNIVQGEVIQKAAAIGTGSTIDLLNTGTPNSIVTTFPDYAQPSGIFANGSVWLQNQAQLSNLGNNGTRLFTSGILAIDDSNPTTAKKLVLPSDIVGNPVTGNADSNKIVPSNVGYPGTNIVLTAAAASNGVKTTDFIEDGWNKIGSVRSLGLDYVPNQPRTVEPFTPAKIDSSTNLARYRALTRNSADGVYINNGSDIERIGTAAMTQAQLLKMLNSDATTPADFYLRNATAGGASLEEKHLRGWVGPDEFLARGALVELLQTTGDPFIRVTYDARSDAIPNGPDPNKTLRDANGNLLPGVYSRDIQWPRNGTLFAEGNIRVRGNVRLPAPPATGNDPFPSLTVVSMNNIYIEGSLSVDNRFAADGLTPASDRKKLMLLAKKNVIVNPTRAVLARTDVQTVATNAAPIAVTGTTGNNPNLILPVANLILFNQGDYVTVQGQTGVIRGVVKNPPAGNQLEIVTSDTDVVPIGNAVVRSPLEKRDAGTGASDHAFFSLVDTENVLNRRVVAPLFADATNRNKITFDHVGELKQTGTDKAGLKVKAEDFTPTAVPRPAGFTALLTNKQPLDAMQDLDPSVRAVNSTNRVLRTTNNFPAPPNQRDFTQASNKTLTAFAAEIRAAEANSLPATAEGYRYTADPTDPLFGALPSSALAGVGLRYAPRSYFDPAATSPAKNRPEDFNADAGVPSKFTIPLATSIEYDVNGSSALIEPSVNSALPAIRYIGFSPNGVSNDDALTVDSSFYQLKSDIFNSTVDPRVLALQEPTTATGFTLSPQTLVLKRPAALSTPALSDLLPDYQVRSVKLENINLSSVGPSSKAIKPVAGDMQINAFVYAQEGSWLMIPSDYFRSNPQIRGEKNGAGELTGSYIDYTPNKTPDAPAAGQPTEYVLDGTAKVADLNRNGIADPGEKEAALRFVRSNAASIKFYGAIIENQTAVVADVLDGTGTTLVKGAVQDWIDKWTSYQDNGTTGGGVGLPNKFNFVSYRYDPTLALGTPAANQLRVPVTDDLLYQQ